MKINFRRNKKNNRGTEYTLGQLTQLKRAIVEAGKEVNEDLKNLKLKSSDDDKYTNTMVELIDHTFIRSENIQKDLATVKKALQVHNVKSGNFENIFDREEAETEIKLLEQFQRNRKMRHPNIFKKLQIGGRIVQLKNRIKKIEARMNKINSSYTIRLNLLSGVQLT